MSDVFPKFVIEDGDLIIANCTYHKEIVTDTSKVIGGGFWQKVNEFYIFSGSSYEFGKAKLEDIKACIANKRVFINKSKKRNVSENGFAYDTGTEIITIQVAINEFA